jgi:biopolymer transport protein ExbB
MLTEQLLKVTTFGAEAILWLLIILFAIEIAIMIERTLFYKKYQMDISNFNKTIRELLFQKNDIEALKKELSKKQSFEGEAILAGLSIIDKGSHSIEEMIESVKSENRIVLEKNLTILGTLGNNTPFIGLFGTVVGIIKAFKDLADASKGGDMLKNGQGAVMAGISEALIATGVGLLVAIPAVIAFNYFMRKVKVINTNTDVLASTLLSYVNQNSESEISFKNNSTEKDKKNNKKDNKKDTSTKKRDK